MEKVYMNPMPEKELDDEGLDYLNYDGPIEQNPYEQTPPEEDTVEELKPEPAPDVPEDGVPQFSAEELTRIREELYANRQAQMKQVELQHQQRLAELAAQERVIRASAQQQQDTRSEFQKVVDEAVNQRLAQTVGPEFQNIRAQMAQQAQMTAIQGALGAGMQDPSMPNFDQISGLAISRYGKDVVMQRIMSDTPANAARWMYQLGLAEAKAVPFAAQAPAQPQAPAPKPAPKAQLPRGMQVQGGAQGMSDADWSSLDKKIDAMSREEHTKFMQNPKNAALFQRMLEYGTTNPKAKLPPRES